MTEIETKNGSEFSREDHVDRVKALVALLKFEKPSEFCTLRCLGFFDDYKVSKKSDKEHCFGLVYEKLGETESPISLYHLIRKDSMPPLSARIQLAHSIATCILYFHAVNWLHKALRSDSVVVFLKETKIDYEHPLITGYEYARPDKDEETNTREGYNRWWELHQHPLYQWGRTQGRYRKTFDTYSLGIILLEIAYWKSVDKVVDIDPIRATRKEFYGICEKLLARDSKYTKYVCANLGNRYCTAMTSCFDARSAFGIREDEAESNVSIGAKLQEKYTALVVDSLEQICV